MCQALFRLVGHISEPKGLVPLLCGSFVLGGDYVCLSYLAQLKWELLILFPPVKPFPNPRQPRQMLLKNEQSSSSPVHANPAFWTVVDPCGLQNYPVHLNAVSPLSRATYSFGCV